MGRRMSAKEYWAKVRARAKVKAELRADARVNARRAKRPTPKN